ncbi:MAG: hypothetical protein AAGG68_01440 [Bacteroidota bacterium]
MSNPANAQEWSFGGELGTTLFSSFQHTFESQEGSSIGRGYYVPHNEGWILNYYPKHEKLFFSIGYTRYHSRIYDVLIRKNANSNLQLSSGTFNRTVSLNVGHQLDIGNIISLPRDRAFFEPLYGLGIEWLKGGNAYTERGIINTENFTYKTGINPSLQAGLRLSYRYRRSKFSVKAFGNFGLRYHAETQFRVELPQEPEAIFTTFRSKSDFIAAQASYEYIFKSGSPTKKKSRQERIERFSRQAFKELRIGTTPLESQRNISLSYEFFPAKCAKTLFMDLTFFERKLSLVKNMSEDENNPEYVFSNFREPYFDLYFGQNLYSEKETDSKWGIGYYIRSELQFIKNKRYWEPYEELTGRLDVYKVSHYAALGANLQYKWLIGDRWSISSALLTDLGWGNISFMTGKYPTLFDKLFLDVQGRIYVGYRF